MKLSSLAVFGISASAVFLFSGCDEALLEGPTARDLGDFGDLGGHSPEEAGVRDRSSDTPPATRAGSALARTPAGDALILADEDHDVVRAIPLPADVRAPRFELALPGHPAQVVALGDRVLVTVRDPGALVELRYDDGGGLYESARALLPSDAWGLAVTADLETAIVTSAWSHRVSAVDLDTMGVRWTVDVGREPRGVVVTESGVAYVSHLVGAPITRIDGLDGDAPRAVRLDLPAAPLRAAHGTRLDASLGYAPVLSPDQSRLFVPRSALGAQREFGWFGTSTVDVLSTADDTGVAPARAVTTLRGDSEGWSMILSSSMIDVDGVVPLDTPTFVQPRAAVYRASTRTLLVAGEGNNMLSELDARSFDPALAPRRAYPLAKHDASLPDHDPGPRYVIAGGAPSAVALSADESFAYVFCRSTYDLVIVQLDPFDRDAGFDPGPPAYLSLASDPISIEVGKGRRLFYDATDTTVSGGYGCAGCHPDGRDDGHTWHENDGSESGAFGGYRGAVLSSSSQDTQSGGFARQTPMLAGRVDAQGPYGWRGESPNLETRLLHGFALHRWGGSMDATYVVAGERPKAIAAFLRKGLSSPPAIVRDLTPVERAGKAIFERADVGCATCHDEKLGFTDRTPAVVARDQHPAFDDEGPVPFKTPSLLFVGSTPPYFHDGATLTLEALIDHNGRAMGDTSELGPTARAALVAYLRTIGGVSDPPAELPLVKTTSEPASGAATYPKRPRRWVPEGVRRVGEERTGKEPCHVQRLNDYAYLSCDPFRAGSIEILAGSARGFDAWTADGVARGTFPLVRGERRLLQATQMSFDGWGGGMSASTAALVEVDWPALADEPTILVR